MNEATNDTLYQRLGGYDAIAAATDELLGVTRALSFFRTHTRSLYSSLGGDACLAWHVSASPKASQIERLGFRSVYLRL